MDLDTFIKYQNESETPLMCISDEHLMPLIPFMTDNLIIELRCFTPNCYYKLIPGTNIYKNILKNING